MGGIIVDNNYSDGIFDSAPSLESAVNNITEKMKAHNPRAKIEALRAEADKMEAALNGVK